MNSNSGNVQSGQGKSGKVRNPKIAKGGKTSQTGAPRKKARKENFSVYIHKVLKQVHPDDNISKISVKILDDQIHQMFEEIAKEAGKICTKEGKSTLGAREIQTAVRLVLPGELAKHAVSEGVKAVQKYDPTQKK
mmetsp:Transcript_3270/g.4754  ORF Transcript_3270/g.4754 Transcript_3270/m.4754 type:complete len:135 (+) Transcript_3270:3623-4027(+)|eukprot:CAMPEP_0175149690 /NCGR_PEP_ID=MMETSP0087-20121206/17394_1 /TAXON_ID=136419 /ORGANISM="Unknown Unknown, Strain D1" /LENGTH=134 /DNA_ID=CAMNT_0016435431 /DNA_START=74 /DNA_END=475 /DNA_ORIENTATION=+